MILRLSERMTTRDRIAIGDGPLIVADAPVADDGDTVLWRALERGATRAELVACVAAECGLDRARAAAGTDEYLRRLRRHGLLREG